MTNSKETSEKKIEQKQGRKWHQVPFTTLYCDDTLASINYGGFKLVFGTKIGDEDGTLLVEPAVCIGMSAEHALQLRNLLNRQLDAYAERFGPVRDLPAGEVIVEEVKQM